MSTFNLVTLCLTMSNLPWFREQHYRFLCNTVLTALDFTFKIRHIHNWVSFPLWPSCFIISGPISNCPPLFKAMAPHSSTLAWKIPWAEEPGRLQSMGLLRVGHDWVTSLSLFTFMHWRRKWQPTPVFLPWESQERGSLVGFHLWGCTELDTTEAT